MAFVIRARVEGLRDLGAPLNPFGAFLLLQARTAADSCDCMHVCWFTRRRPGSPILHWWRLYLLKAC